MWQKLKRHKALFIAIILIVMVFLGVDIFFWPMLPQPFRAAILGLDPTNTRQITGLMGQINPWCGGTDPGEEDGRIAENNPAPVSNKKVFLRQGSYNTFSPIVAAMKSDSNGEFVIDLPAGSYCPLEITFLPGPCKPFKLVSDKEIYDSPRQYNGLKVEDQDIGYVVFFFSKGCPGPPRP